MGRAPREAIAMRALFAACLCLALVGADCAPARGRVTLPGLVADATPGLDATGQLQAAGGSSEAGTTAASDGRVDTGSPVADGSTPEPSGPAAAAPAQDEGEFPAPAHDKGEAPAGSNDGGALAPGATGEQVSPPAHPLRAVAGDSSSPDSSKPGSADQSAASSEVGSVEPTLGSGARQTLGGAGLGRVAVAVPAPSTSPVLSGLLDGLLPDEDLADYGLVLEDLSTGARTGINNSQTFPSASLYKLGVAWIALRRVDAGTLSLDEPIMIEDSDTVEPEPYGGFGEGDAPTLGEALAGMLSISSNAAAHALLRIIGRDAFTEEMDRLGMTQTRVPDDGLAVTSPDDIAHLLRLIATSPELSPASRELIGQHMLSIAPPDALRDTLPDSIGIYDKTGNLDDASNVGALLQSPRATAILVVIDTGVNPGNARGIIAQAGMIAYHALLQ
jgi:Beta-lactamase enzyme family